MPGGQLPQVPNARSSQLPQVPGAGGLQHQVPSAGGLQHQVPSIAAAFLFCTKYSSCSSTAFHRRINNERLIRNLHIKSNETHKYEFI
jgi:hypothetical protein